MASESFGRFAVFSDVHANLAALLALFDFLDLAGIERSYCCGDLVGYGAHPNACCDRIRERNIPTVRGNHDQTALTLDMVDQFNAVARTAIAWTHERLTHTNQMFIRELPMKIVEEKYTFVHSSPFEPDKWHYVVTEADARQCFEYFDNTICFIGHSHQPFIVELTNGKINRLPADRVVDICEGSRYLVNVGSVGQPRDGNPELACFLVDEHVGIMRLHRQVYPVDQAQAAIFNENLPPELADRLGLGY
jgi:predicted phosphodiesterase